MTPSNELQIYTWLDATLKELTGLVKEVNPEARRRGTYFDFSLVYPDLRQSPRCQSRDIGTTVAGQRGPDDQKTLADCKFVIEEMVDSETETAIGIVSGTEIRMDSEAEETEMLGTGSKSKLIFFVLCLLSRLHIVPVSFVNKAFNTS